MVIGRIRKAGKIARKFKKLKKLKKLKIVKKFFKRLLLMFVPIVFMAVLNWAGKKIFSKVFRKIKDKIKKKVGKRIINGVKGKVKARIQRIKSERDGFDESLSENPA
ncbi:MAG: hypothetical protein K6E91_08475 [Butyrivibrio sp.]|nr:hypothetical protein [Butyrivibrio sp.]